MGGGGQGGGGGSGKFGGGGTRNEGGGGISVVRGLDDLSPFTNRTHTKNKTKIYI